MTGVAGPVAAAVACAVSGLALWHDRGRRGGALEMAALVSVLPLALVIAGGRDPLLWAPLTLAIVTASLSRERDDLLHTECALKLAWTLGAALALSAAGIALLALLTATTRLDEQWGVLAFTAAAQLEPGALWAAALPLSLLAGVVLLGAAPFHFWPADVLQGARPWIGPPATVALQIGGASWLASRVAGIDRFADAARLVDGMVTWAAAVSLGVGAVTLLYQRRPERRVGTLASLQGGLALAWLAAHGGRAEDGAPALLAWGAHLALAVAGAAIVARFMPVSSPVPAAPAVLFRRHPAWGICGLYALGSLAGAPGTPGARIWLEVAREAASAGRTGLLLALAAAWLAAFVVVVGLVREAFGVGSPDPAPPNPVPWEWRAAMLVTALGLVALFVV